MVIKDDELLDLVKMVHSSTFNRIVEIGAEYANEQILHHVKSGVPVPNEFACYDKAMKMAITVIKRQLEEREEENE